MQDPAPIIRVGVVEDDPRFRHALCASVQADGAMQLCWQASTVAEALGHVQATSRAPDVLVLDMGLPDGSGLEVLAVVRVQWPQCSVLVYTGFSDENHVLHAIEAGAVGYVLKDARGIELSQEIRCAHEGGSPISPLIARQILQRFSAPGLAPTAKLASTPAQPSRETSAGKAVEQGTPLSPREQEVLVLLTKGYTVDEIAALLSKLPAPDDKCQAPAALSRHTVLHFVRRIYVKLQVNSKAEAIFEARLRGLI